MSRRPIRIHRIAPDGRRYILEERQGQRLPQIRIWLPDLARYRRVTLPCVLRNPDGRRDPDALARALADADHRVLTEPTLGGTPPTAPLSVGDILAYACDPQTTRSRRAGSHQLTEWKRARREAEALLLHHLPFERLTGDHIGALGRSALLRTSLGCELPRWSELLASVLDAGQLADATHLKDRVDRAAAAWLSARATTNSAGELSTTGSWGKRAAQLLRAMFRHAVSRGGTRFKPVAGFEIPMDFTVELEVTADDHEITVEDPNQPRQDATAARNLMRHLGDPRYYMAAVLATVLNAKGAMRACRSQVRVDANGVAIRHNNGSAERPQWTWYELDASAAAFMRWLLAGPYAPLESERRAGGPDYRLVADVRWDGVRAQRIRALSDMPDPEADALLDPRGWLLFVLGVEGRAGQVVRAMRSNLRVEGTAEAPLLDVPGARTKRGPWWLLAPSQVAPLAFAMRVGYLAAYERAYRAGEIRDYPLFPEGMLRKGRAAVLPKAKPIDRKVISRRWAADARRILGLPKMEGDAMYGWRRCLMDLHERWDTDARVKDLLVGHGAIRNPEQSSTRVKVYLNRKDLHLLSRAQRLVEHTRTGFVATGDGPSPERFAVAAEEVAVATPGMPGDLRQLFAGEE